MPTASPPVFRLMRTAPSANPVESTIDRHRHVVVRVGGLGDQLDRQRGDHGDDDRRDVRGDPGPKKRVDEQPDGDARERGVRECITDQRELAVNEERADKRRHHRDERAHEKRVVHEHVVEHRDPKLLADPAEPVAPQPDEAGGEIVGAERRRIDAVNRDSRSVT